MTKTPIAVLGIDLGKNSCSLAGLDATGAVIMRRRMTREGTIKFVAALPACVVAMEACCGAHFLGRTFASPHGAADVAGIRCSLCEGAGCHAADDAAGDAEERGTVGSAGAAPGQGETGGRSDAAYQPVPGGAA